MFRKGDKVKVDWTDVTWFDTAYERLNKFSPLIVAESDSYMLRLENIPSFWNKAAFKLINNTVVILQHDGHIVVVNSSDGKDFKYCRNCKVEVD
jgi:hypothetical protein